MKTPAAGITIWCCCLLSGCVVGPAFHAPAVNTPAAWTSPAPPAIRSETEIAREWWKTFKDPELNSLIARGAKANLDVRIAAARIREARASQGISEAALRPSVSTSDGVTRVRGGIAQGLTRAGIVSGSPQSRTTLLTPFETGICQLGFDSSWELDFVGGARRTVEAAKFDVLASEKARDDALVTVLGEIGAIYMQLRGTQRELAVVENNMEVQRQLVELTVEQARAGLAPELDVIRASAQLSSNQAALPPLRAATAREIRSLSVLLGGAPDSLDDELQTPAPLPSIPDSIPVGLPFDLLTRRSDVRRAEAALGAQTARVGVARSDLFPKITLTGLVGRQAGEPSGLTLGVGNYFSAGPGVRLPIFSGGRIRSNIRVQDARLDEAALQYQSRVLQALDEVENGLSAFAREKERQAHLLDSLRQSDEAVTLTTELYARGLGDFLAVLDARRAKLATEDDLAQSETRVAVDLVALYKALGGGW